MGNFVSTLDQFNTLQQHIAKRIIGQKNLVHRLLIALLADGHLLVEGAPGLAKTRAVKVLADGLEADFHRTQFTPDLLPADITGTDIYRQQQGTFEFQQGPLFHNLVLVDEVNRAPAKVQSALLEAMAERQITVGRTTHTLPQLFLVMATQNPLEQEGTYSLPEAQLDRFLMQVNISYPPLEEEREILLLARSEAKQEVTGDMADTAATLTETPDSGKLSQQTVSAARREVLDVFLAENVQEYILQLIIATRQPARYSQYLATCLQYGGSPRATIALDRCARAHAWLRRSEFVDPGDVQAVLPDVLRHRLILNFEAEAEGMDVEQAIQELLTAVPVP